MIKAWFRVRRQLYKTKGMIRYSTGIANLTEFYTVTLWENEMDMFAFMSSDAHRDMMWNFSKWSESFWAMRWDASTDEVGAWTTSYTNNNKGFHDQFDVTLGRSSHSTRNPVQEWLIEKGLGKHLEMPDKLDAKSPQAHGIPGTMALLARIPAKSPPKYYKILTHLGYWRAEAGIIKLSVCIGFGECIVIAILNAGALEESRRLMLLLENFFPDAWAMRFKGHDYEVGHWDGLRLREILLPDNQADITSIR